MLDLAKVGGRRKLRTPKEFPRNGERRTINGLGDREASVFLMGTVLNLRKTKGRCRNQSEPAKRESRADLRDLLNLLYSALVC